MDTKTLVKKLREAFSETLKEGRKYSQIWLSPLDYDGLYQSDDFVLKLRSEYKIERYLTEITAVSNVLRKNFKEELKQIVSVVVYGPNEKAECEADDYLVYEEATACL